MTLTAAAARQTAINRFGADCDFGDPRVVAYAATFADRADRLRLAVDRLASEPGTYSKFEVVFPMLMSGAPVETIVAAVRAAPNEVNGAAPPAPRPRRLTDEEWKAIHADDWDRVARSTINLDDPVWMTPKQAAPELNLKPDGGGIYERLNRRPIAVKLRGRLYVNMPRARTLSGTLPGEPQ